ncbi:hypothetical protein ACFX2H_013018 [Malus domestica]
MSEITADLKRPAVPENIINEDLQTTLLQMLQRLENASVCFIRKTDLVMGPTIPISLPLLGEKDDGKEERKKFEASQLDEETTLVKNPPSLLIFLQKDQGQVEAMVDKHADPFLEAPVNMINLAWAEKGKGKVARETEEERPADKSTKGVIKLPEHPKAAIIKGMVLCSRCQCECELEIPPTGVLIDHELIRRKEKEERKKAREKARRTAGRDTSRSVFQRLGGDSQPRALSEVFQNHEASEEVEKKSKEMIG